jgi:hypothetical protein
MSWAVFALPGCLSIIENGLGRSLALAQHLPLVASIAAIQTILYFYNNESKAEFVVTS